MTDEYRYEPSAFDRAIADYYEAHAHARRVGTDEAHDAAIKALEIAYAAPCNSAREAREKIELFIRAEDPFEIDGHVRALLDSLTDDFSRAIESDRTLWTPTEAERAQDVTPAHARPQ